MVKLLALLLAVPTLAVASSEVNWAICEFGTQCKKCVEKGSLVIEQKADKVVVSGKSPQGVPVNDELTECDIRSETNWTCNGGRMRVVNQDSRIKVEYTGRPVSINDKKLEFCSSQVR